MKHPDILLVDDDEDVLEVGITALREAGFEPLPAISGDVALVLLEQGLPFELLITDVVMPGALDGYALARHAQGLRPDLRVLYTTGYAGMVTFPVPGAPHGETLVKPWSIDDLVAAAQRALRREARRSGLRIA
jgi:DNA-binding NtrC family response regulator